MRTREAIENLDRLNVIEHPVIKRTVAREKLLRVLELGDAFERLSNRQLAQVVKERFLDDQLEANTVEYTLLTEVFDRLNRSDVEGEYSALIFCIHCQQELDVTYALDEGEPDVLTCGNVLCEGRSR